MHFLYNAAILKACRFQAFWNAPQKSWIIALCQAEGVISWSNVITCQGRSDL